MKSAAPGTEISRLNERQQSAQADAFRAPLSYTLALHAMALAAEIETLSSSIDILPRKAIAVLGEAGASLYVLDFIVIGAIKRTLSLASGLLVLIEARNIVCVAQFCGCS
jgi:hypothetical protein